MGSAIQQGCLDCDLRPERFPCDLPADALAEFDSIKRVQRFPKGAILFSEGQTVRRVVILCAGRVRLTVDSKDGKPALFRIAGPGDVLGLSASLCDHGHEATAEALEPVQAAVIPRNQLLQFLRSHREACVEILRVLSQDLEIAYQRVRAVGLARTRRARVPRQRLI